MKLKFKSSRKWNRRRENLHFRRVNLMQNLEKITCAGKTKKKIFGNSNFPVKIYFYIAKRKIRHQQELLRIATI